MIIVKCDITYDTLYPFSLVCGACGGKFCSGCIQVNRRGTSEFEFTPYGTIGDFFSFEAFCGGGKFVVRVS